MKKKTKININDSTSLTDSPFQSLSGTSELAPFSDESKTIQNTPKPPPFQVSRTRKGGWPITLEKRPGGKQATLIRNVSGDGKELLRVLRKQCGAGGVYKNDCVEIQGDQCKAVETFLNQQLGKKKGV